MRIIPIQALAAAVVTVLLAACSGSGEGGPGNPRVVASFFPLAEVARAVGGADVEVVTLTPPGVEPHDLELTSAQVESANDADVLVYLGRGFQPALQDLARTIDSRVVDGLSRLPVVGDDVHVWLDPTLLGRIVIKVQGALAQADPENRPTYAANARKYRAELTALDREFATGLAECDRNVVVTSHAAYLYLTSRYQLEQEAVTGASPESEPSPARMAEVTELIRDSGVTTVFTEPLAGDGPAATLARETGVTTAVLDPLEGPPRDAPTATYPELMRKNLAVLRTALGCR